MGKKVKSFDEYKQEMVGTTFGWLTVIDVFRDESGSRICKCVCKCGNTVIKDMRKVYNHHTTSCGCYVHSKEKSDKLKNVWKDNSDKRESQSQKLKQYYEDHPETADLISDKLSKFYSDNPNKAIERGHKYSEWASNNRDKILEQGRKHSQFYKDNPDIAKQQGEKISKFYRDNPEKLKARVDKRKLTLSNNPEIQEQITYKNKKWAENNKDIVKSIATKNSIYYKNIRINTNFSEIINYIHPDQLADLLSGNIVSQSTVKLKCPVCGNYSEHSLHNVFHIKSCKLKQNHIPMCKSCFSSYVIASSKYEAKIANYISEFYNGKCIRNSRNIISPFELDLYYPEKKIAVEFNGDYWHSREFKSEDYHYNKFKLCRDIGITLVSIFETEWISKRDVILDYIRDLFDSKVNKLSFVNEDYMNNNYPAPGISINNDYVISNYLFRDDIVVNTCGLSKIINL